MNVMKYYQIALYSSFLAFTAPVAEAAEKAKDEGLPQFDVTTFPSQIFWLSVTFVILYLFFSKKTLPDISGTIKSRREHINNDLDTAEKLRTESEEVHEAYEKQLEEARARSTAILSDMQTRVRKKSDDSNLKYQQKLNKEIAEMEKNIEAARNKSMKEMETIAAEIASEAAEKIVGLDTDIEQARNVIRSLHNGKAKAA